MASPTPECRIDDADAMANKISKMQGRELSRLANFVLVDVRLIFVIVSVYITISSAIMSAANNEAAADANGNGTFDLSSRSDEHIDRDISDVSNSVLWNCRENAVSRRYYRLLYGSLLGSFGLILLVFLLTRLSILWGNMRQELNYLKKAMWHIQIIKCLRYYLKNKRCVDQVNPNRFQACDKLVKNLSEGRWPSSIMGIGASTEHNNEEDEDTNDTKYKINKAIFCSLLIIPFCESLFLIVALPFMLTTYDLNPIGCLVGPDEDAIEYNNVTGRVQLQFTKGVLNYQTAALVIFLVLMLGSILIFACLLLLHYDRITKKILKQIAEKVKNEQQA